MGRGSSKGGGGGGGARASGTTKTVGMESTINDLNNLVQQDSARYLRERLAQIPNGDTITLYSPERDRNGHMTGGVNPDSVVSFRKRDGQWEQVNGPAWSNQRPTDGDLARRAMNNFNRFYPGVGTTESHVKIDGRRRTIEGTTVEGGTFDILARGKNSTFVKKEVRGNLTTINGQQYGIRKLDGEYNITHTGTGLLVNNSRTPLKTMAQAVNYLKTFTMPSGPVVENAERRMKTIFRED